MQLNKTQLLKAFNRGDIETVAKELNRYATITKDKSWTEENKASIYYGENRIKEYGLYKGFNWRVEMTNGEVRSLSYSKKENSGL